MEKGKVVDQKEGVGGGGIVEKRGVVDQKAERALAVIRSRLRLFARQGAVVATWRWYRGRKLGPYWRLAYREAGRQCSVYLGRTGPGVERVRRVLARLQRGLRSRRTVRRVSRAVRASLRSCLAELDRQLHGLGLWRKGFEVRGGWSRALERHFALYGGQAALGTGVG